MKPLTNSPIGIFEDFRLSFNEFVLETYHTPVEAKSRIRTFAQFKDYTKAIAFRVYSVQMAIKKGVDKQDNVKNSIDHSFYVYLHDRLLRNWSKK